MLVVIDRVSLDILSLFTSGSYGLGVCILRWYYRQSVSIHRALLKTWPRLSQVVIIDRTSLFSWGYYRQFVSIFS